MAISETNPGSVASYDLQPANRVGPVFWKVRDRREGKMHKKGRRKITNRKGKQKQII